MIPILITPHYVLPVFYKPATSFFGDTNGKVSQVTNGFSLVGNPYASPVDLSVIAFAQLPNTSYALNNLVYRFYIWDANLTGSTGVGGYVVLDDADFNVDGSGALIYTKSTGGTATPADLAIQSGQAFFVQTTFYDYSASQPASITFQESAKSAVPNFIFRPAVPATAPSSPRSVNLSTVPDKTFSATLSLLNSDSSASLTDGTVAKYNDGYCACVDYMDAPKLSNQDETFALSRSGKTLAIERRPTIQKNDTLFISIANMTQRSYQLGFTAGLLNNQD
ncbi:MAG: hypothetical protein WDM71_02520 [Ferruginibacter sp.]